MTGLLRAAAAAGVLIAGLVLTGCATDPETQRSGGAGTGSGAGAGAGAERGEPVELPWPADSAADAAALQAAADTGSQPWLLDPSEVAISYAATAHGWTDAEAYPGPAGSSVDVRNARGERLTLTLAQPTRAGEGGIWVVVAERPA